MSLKSRQDIGFEQFVRRRLCIVIAAGGNDQQMLLRETVDLLVTVALRAKAVIPLALERALLAGFAVGFWWFRR